MNGHVDKNYGMHQHTARWVTVGRINNRQLWDLRQWTFLNSLYLTFDFLKKKTYVFILKLLHNGTTSASDMFFIFGR